MRNRADHPNEPRDRCKRQRVSRQLDHDLTPRFVSYMFYILGLFSLQAGPEEIAFVVEIIYEVSLWAVTLTHSI